MGASSSKSKAEINNKVINESYNKCPSTTAINQADIKYVIHQPMDTCVSSSFNIDQSASVDATCLITAMQENLAKVINEMDTKAKAGIGYANAKSDVEIKNILKNKIDNECGNVSPTNKANIQDTIVRACDFKIIQNANAKSACQIGAMQKATLDASNSVSTTAEGMDFALFGGVLLMIVIFIAMIVGIYYLFSSSNTSKGASSNYTQYYEQPYNQPNISSPMFDISQIEQACKMNQNNKLCQQYQHILKKFKGGFDSSFFSYESLNNNEYKIVIILGLLFVFYFLLQKNKLLKKTN